MEFAEMQPVWSVLVCCWWNLKIGNNKINNKILEDNI